MAEPMPSQIRATASAPYITHAGINIWYISPEPGSLAAIVAPKSISGINSAITDPIAIVRTPKTIKALRSRTQLPFDAHLMIAKPGRYIEQYVAAGCDSITIHVEVEEWEEVEPTLVAIRRAGRAAGLSLRPRTPIAALERYRSSSTSSWS